jgi:hypothetical protein
MPRFRSFQTSFTAGELDPRLVARTDVKYYYSGAEELTNVLVLPQGGVTRRPGMRTVFEFPASDAYRLIPFSFNSSQTYLHVLLNNRLMVFRGDTRVANLSAPWTAAQIPVIGWVQSADTLILMHPDFAPLRVVRGGSDASWTISTVPLINIPGWDSGSVASSGTMTPSATSGDITLTAGAAGFSAGDVGWYLRSLDGGLARITGYVSTSVVNARVLSAFENTSPIDAANWRLLEPVISASRGWPSCGTFHQGRLFFGGLRSRPSTLIASKVGEFFDFDPGDGLDDEGLQFTIDSDRVDAIQHLASGRALIVFTSGAEYAAIVNGPLTPTNFLLTPQTQRGSKANVRPVEVDGALIFVQRGGRALREFLYVDVEQAYLSNILSLLAAHLIADPVAMAIRKGTAQDDADYILLVNADGGVTVLNTLRSQEVTAFSRMVTDGLVKDVAVVEDVVWWLVLRAGTMRLERWAEAAGTDASVRIFGPSTGITGAISLANRTVQVILDDAQQLDQQISATGAATWPRPATIVAEIGLPFTTRIRTMPIDARLAEGTMVGSRVRIVRAVLRLHETQSVKVRRYDPQAGNAPGIVVPMRRVGPDMLDRAPPRFTGDAKVEGLLGWSDRAQLEILQDAPLPMTVLGLAHDVSVG